MSISNKCKLFQDVDNILLGTVDYSSPARFFFLVGGKGGRGGELTWLSGGIEGDQSSPTEKKSIKRGLWKISIEPG